MSLVNADLLQPLAWLVESPQSVGSGTCFPDPLLSLLDPKAIASEGTEAINSASFFVTIAA